MSTLTVAVYGSVDQGLEVALGRFGDWKVVRRESDPERVTPDPDVIVCSELAYLPVVRQWHPEPLPVVYTCPSDIPYTNHPAFTYTRYLLLQEHVPTVYLASIINKVDRERRGVDNGPSPEPRPPVDPEFRLAYEQQHTIAPGLDRLAPYQGGSVRINAYHLSHSRVQLCIMSPTGGPPLYILCTACLYIQGPFRWNDAHLTLEASIRRPGTDVQFTVKDDHTGFALTCLLFKFTDLL